MRHSQPISDTKGGVSHSLAIVENVKTHFWLVVTAAMQLQTPTKSVVGQSANNYPKTKSCKRVLDTFMIARWLILIEHHHQHHHNHHHNHPPSYLLFQFLHNLCCPHQHCLDLQTPGKLNQCWRRWSSSKCLWFSWRQGHQWWWQWYLHQKRSNLNHSFIKLDYQLKN